MNKIRRNTKQKTNCIFFLIDTDHIHDHDEKWDPTIDSEWNFST